MAPVRGTRHEIFLGFHKSFANLMRLILFAGNRRNDIALLEYSSFNADEKWRDLHMSPERRAYLSQIARNQIDSNLASPEIPYRFADLSNSVPRWKMAILTLFGVCFTVGVVGLFLVRTGVFMSGAVACTLCRWRTTNGDSTASALTPNRRSLKIYR